MKPIIVVDSIMGSGKTSWAIEYMRNNPNHKYIFVTPFLDEITRIRSALPELEFYEPNYKRSDTKLEDFNLLLMDGRNVATTHCTFSASTPETIEYLKAGHYTLVLDEVLDVLVGFNEACGDRITNKDVDALLERGFIEVDQFGKVTWIAPDYTGSAYTNVERTARNGTLFLLDGKFLVWSFPAEIFALFEDVYVLTYLFDGSYLKPYFAYHEISFTLRSVKRDGDSYRLTDYDPAIAERQTYKNLITIWGDHKLNAFDAASLSKSWFDRKKRKDPKLKELKNMIYTFFHNATKAKAADILWTCPKEDYPKLKGDGYTKRPLTEAEKAMTDKERSKLKRDCFLSCNTRATNDYADRSVLAYIFNLFPNPYVKRYFENKNAVEHTDIHVDEDMLALSAMLQWIWRSRIRNLQPITIWIPSTRMRNLFVTWLNGRENVATDISVA